VLALRTFPAFEALTPAELAVMAEHVRPRLFEKGALVLRREVPVRALHFVVSGRVELLRGGRLFRSLGPHDVVGGLASLVDEPLREHAVAAEETITLQLDRDDMADVFEDNFPIFGGVLRVMARMLVAARKKLGSDAGDGPASALGPARVLRQLGLVERILVLRDSMDFAEAEIEALADLAQEAEEIDLPPGRTLWKIGDAADHFVIVIDGHVCCALEDGKELSYGPGTVIGAVNSLSAEPRWYAAKTAERVRGLRIQTQNLLDVIEDNMGVGMNLLRVIARRIQEVGERVSDPGAAQTIA
jgi:CRP-like cAMP-binding protein